MKTPQNKFYFWPLLFGILILMYVFEFQTEKNLNHYGHLIDRRHLFSLFNELNKTYAVCFRWKVTPSTDICRPSFDNRVFKDNIEPADIKIII